MENLSLQQKIGVSEFIKITTKAIDRYAKEYARDTKNMGISLSMIEKDKEAYTVVVDGQEAKPVTLQNIMNIKFPLPGDQRMKIVSKFIKEALPNLSSGNSILLSDLKVRLLLLDKVIKLHLYNGHKYVKELQWPDLFNKK